MGSLLLLARSASCWVRSGEPLTGARHVATAVAYYDGQEFAGKVAFGYGSASSHGGQVPETKGRGERGGRDRERGIQPRVVIRTIVLSHFLVPTPLI